MRIEEINYQEVLKLRQEVMYPDKDLDFVKLEEDDKGLHIGIYDDAHLASVVSLFIADRDIQFRKLATQISFQNKGYASKLIKYILDYANEMKFNRVWANSRANIYPFYEKFGFHKTDETFTKNGHDYIIIEYKIEKGRDI